ncbi:MAG: hypothetical protein C4321_09910 [Chloroflexota bacterium]
MLEGLRFLPREPITLARGKTPTGSRHSLPGMNAVGVCAILSSIVRTGAKCSLRLRERTPIERSLPFPGRRGRNSGKNPLGASCSHWETRISGVRIARKRKPALRWSLLRDSNVFDFQVCFPIQLRGTHLMSLSPQDVTRYRQDGFLVLEELVSAEEITALRERARHYTHGDRPRGALVVQIEPRVERGEMQVEHPGDGIRKIDRLVQENDLFRALALHPRIVDVLTAFLGPDLKLFRNSLMLKPPEVGSQKGWHQDSPY